MRATIQHFGPAWAFLLLGVAECAALACLLRLRSAGIAAEVDPTPLRRNIADYLREIATNRTLLILTVVTALVEVFGTSYHTALPELAIMRLEIDAGGFGLLHGAQAAGGLIAGLILTWYANIRRRGIAYVGVVTVLGAGIVALGAMTSVPGVLLILALVAGMICAWDILTQAMMQLCVPNRLRGRAMGAWVFAIGSSPLGHLEMGILASTLGPRPRALPERRGSTRGDRDRSAAVPRAQALLAGPHGGRPSRSSERSPSLCGDSPG